jgi:hypothetical protein
MKKDLLLKTLRNISAAAVYIFLVSQVMQNGDKLFGTEDNILAPFAVLLLFSLSAAVVGGLVIGYPVYLFFDNKKKESVTAVIYSVGWLGVFTLLALLVLVLAN